MAVLFYFLFSSIFLLKEVILYSNIALDQHFTTPSEIFDETGKQPLNNHVRQAMYAQQTPVANVEVFLVIDKYMVEFHGNESVHDYVLTMMNMVSDMYKDPSLGVLINIVVSKVLILHEDLPNLNISHNGDKTLFSFCEWQFLRELSDSNNNKNSYKLKYDVALLLTRKDVCAHSDHPCGTIGLAYIGGMCTPNRKCGVVEDIGLNTAYTIAHELGHNLGMTHDGLDNSCKTKAGGYPHIMASKWPTANHVSMKWSTCSRKNLIQFLSSYKSYCIRENENDNHIADYQLSGILPGKLYDVDTQCKQQYGGVAKHCKNFKISGQATDICKQLWCEIEEEQECVSKLDPAAKGTKCAEGKWCMYGQCVNNTDIPDSIDGGWGEWKNWTTCSRTCGVGVSYMERLCNMPIPSSGGRYCIGDGRKYVTCNVQSCPEKSTGVRRMQCEQYNNKTLTYIPIHSETQPCALHCRPKTNNAHYSVKFQQKVIDGTPCREGSTDICIDGKCEKLGCDMKLKSKLEKDICGVCGGKGEGCNLIEGEFTQPLGKGYVNAVNIPLGAKNVLVKEVKPCASFLALKSGHGSYHINGNWTIELPGRYNVNGTVVYYRRRGTQEFFFTDGPTKAEMHFMVLYQDFNFGVKYRYVLPINQTAKLQQEEAEALIKEKKYKGSFGWMQGSWDRCSVVCGGGVMHREKPRCLHMYGAEIHIVNDTLCSGAKMPPSPIKTCNEHECPKVWFVTPWNTCSTTCGLGRKKRNVSCKGQQKDGSWKDSAYSECSVSGRPVSIQTCVEKSCYLSWKLSGWSKCRAKCGQYGLKYRSVTCPMANACLVTVKPAMTRSCIAPKCEYSWIPEPWTQCSTTCGIGIETRQLLCREQESFQIAKGKCKGKREPKIQRKCFQKICTYYRRRELVPQRSQRVAMIPHIRHEERAPRIKRKPRQRSLIYKSPLRKLTTSKRITRTETLCEKDELMSWECNMKIIISKYANKPFCTNPKERRRCCRSCQKHETNGSRLPITPRKQNG